MFNASMRRTIARTAVLATLLIVALPASSQAFSKAFWGPTEGYVPTQFPIFSQLGVSIYETDLVWSNVATRRPHSATDFHDAAYQWPAYVDQAIAAASRFHMRVMLQVIYTPPWANGGRPRNWAPNRPQDLASFATAAARRYPGVHLWMIWGEPTRRPNFQPLTPAKPGAKLNHAQQIAPHNYARLLDASYGALKAVSNANTVIGGASYTTGDIDTFQWIQNLRLPNGRPPRMDQYAHNPFSYTPPSFSVSFSSQDQVQFSDLPRLAHWIDRYLRPGLPIFLSEWTIPTAPDYEFDFYVSAPTAARWIKDAMRLARGWHRISALGWVHLYDSGPTTYGGLYDNHGKKKPGFAAFAHG